MQNRTGFQTFVNFTSQGSTPQEIVSKKGVYARVVHVVLGPKIVGTDIPDYYYKNSTSIGSITYQLLKGNQDGSKQAAGNPIAYPIQANLKIYPLEGEIVEIVSAPSSDMNDDYEAPQTYYKSVVNLWNSNHHNAFPSMTEYAKFKNSAYIRTYQQSEIDNQPNNLQSSSINYALGPNFYEKSDIKTLYPFPGDVILEGRWGNSIRFGSTQYFQKDISLWSRDTGSIGNPITIIRNGQGKQLDPDAWVPTVEDINRDPSSIYLTQGQKIVIDDIQRSFSLASLGVVLENTYTNAVPLQQILTSVDSLSPEEQDRRVSSISTKPEEI